MNSRTQPTQLAALAVGLGAVMMIAVPAATADLLVWAHLYGAILVWLAVLEYLAVAIGLVFWGVGQLRG